MIAVVIPTIRGREALLTRTQEAYQASADVRLIVVRDRPTIGQAWNDGAAVALDMDGIDYLHLSADDVEPLPGWDQAATQAADDGIYPSPRIMETSGALHSCGTMGGGMLLPECASGTRCMSSPFPFLRMPTWKLLGPSLPIHYYADDYLGWRARCAGLDVQVMREYALTHLEGIAGRSRMVQRSAQDRAHFLAAVGLESPAPAEVMA